MTFNKNGKEVFTGLFGILGLLGSLGASVSALADEPPPALTLPRESSGPARRQVLGCKLTRKYLNPAEPASLQVHSADVMVELQDNMQIDSVALRYQTANSADRLRIQVSLQNRILRIRETNNTEFVQDRILADLRTNLSGRQFTMTAYFNTLYTYIAVCRMEPAREIAPGATYGAETAPRGGYFKGEGAQDEDQVVQLEGDSSFTE